LKALCLKAYWPSSGLVSRAAAVLRQHAQGIIPLLTTCIGSDSQLTTCSGPNIAKDNFNRVQKTDYEWF